VDLPYRHTHFFSQGTVRGQAAVAHADVVFTYRTRVVTPLTQVGLYEGETLRLQHYNRDRQKHFIVYTIFKKSISFLILSEDFG